MAEPGIYETMRTLRSVRRLRPDPIPDEVLHRVLQAATWAPSGGNRQPWRMIVVKDAATKRKLGEIYGERWNAYKAHYTAQLTTETPQAVRDRIGRAYRAGDYMVAHFHQTPALVVFCFDPSVMAITDAKLDRISVVGGASVYPAVQNLLLACRAEGLGCVLTTLACASEPEVRRLLEIPDPWGTAALVPIGYPVGSGHGPLSRNPLEQMAFIDRWGKPATNA